jgi:hypothetical protein
VEPRDKSRVTGQDVSAGNAEDFYSEGASFESPKVFCGSPLSLQAKTGIVPRNRRRPSPSTYFSDHHSLITLSFDAV